MIEHIKLRKYNNNDYTFVYEIKKNAYKKICRTMLGCICRRRATRIF